MLSSFELVIILPALIAGSFFGTIMICILAEYNPQKILASITTKFLIAAFSPFGFSTSILQIVKSSPTFYNKAIVSSIKMVSSVSMAIIVILCSEIIGQKYFPLLIGLVISILFLFIIVVTELWQKTTNGFEIITLVSLAVLVNIIAAVNNLAIKSANLFALGSVENLLTGAFIVIVFFTVLRLFGAKNFNNRYFYILLSLGLFLGPFYFLFNIVLALLLEAFVGLFIKIFGDESYKNIFPFTLFLYVGFLITVLSMLFS